MSKLHPSRILLPAVTVPINTYAKKRNLEVSRPENTCAFEEREELRPILILNSVKDATENGNSDGTTGSK